jgi:6-phosphogluconate dehydrogenase
MLNSSRLSLTHSTRASLALSFVFFFCVDWLREQRNHNQKPNHSHLNDSYLVEITAEIMVKKAEDKPEEYMLDLILDKAGQKGTGKWTGMEALDLGMPLTLIGEAVFARCLSAQKDERVSASKVLSGPSVPAIPAAEKAVMVDAIASALYASKLVSYAQGFVLLQAAAAEYHWELDYGSISSMWRGGCIIRSAFLGNIKQAYTTRPGLPNLLLDPFFSEKVQSAQEGWRKVAATAMLHGVPVPAITTALCYYDGYRTAQGSANMIQAQRDYFGAHTFERKDQPRGQVFHCNWTGRGGTTTATNYDK